MRKKSDGKKSYLCTSGPFAKGKIWLSPTEPETAIVRIGSVRGKYQGLICVGKNARREAIWCPQ